jgi:outer membrane protein assembly factor BamB
VASTGQGDAPREYTLTTLATATGRQLWQDSVQANDARATIGPGIVLVTQDNAPDRPTIESRDPRTGVRRWKSGDIGPIGPPPVTDGATIVTFSQQDAHGLRATDGHQLWTMPGSYQAAAVTIDAVCLAQPKPPKNQPPQGD